MKTITTYRSSRIAARVVIRAKAGIQNPISRSGAGHGFRTKKIWHDVRAIGRSLQLGGIVAAISSSFFLPMADAVLIDRIVAVVGQEIITQSELARHLTHDESKKDISSPSDPNLLRRLIEKRIIFQAALHQGMQVTDRELEHALSDIEQRNQFPNREAFKNAILASSLSWEEYRDALKTEVATAKLLHREMDSGLFVTDQEAKDYYERYPKRFGQADQIALEQILFSVAGFGSWEAAQRTAEGVQTEIENGVLFDQIVEHHKEEAVPLAGMFKKGDLLPEVERVVFDLAIGEVSPVIKTSTGFHLFRVKEKITGGSFEASRPAIVSFLLNEKQNLLTRKWFSQLREQTFIEIK